MTSKLSKGDKTFQIELTTEEPDTKKYLDSFHYLCGRESDYPVYFLSQQIEGKISIISKQESKKSYELTLEQDNEIIYMIKDKKKTINADKLQISSEVIQFSETSKEKVIKFSVTPKLPKYESYLSSSIQKYFRIKASIKPQSPIAKHHELILYIIIINPILSPEQNILCLNIHDQLYSILLELNKSSFSNQDTVTGNIVFKRENEGPDELLSTLVIEMISTESYDNNIISEKTLCKYQLFDGTPYNGMKAPFILQLTPMKIWPYSNSDNLKVIFRLKLVAFKTNELKLYEEKSDFKNQNNTCKDYKYLEKKLNLYLEK